MTMRDRVKELRRVPASELRANPKNWRRHPPAQKAALEGVLEDIGFADVVIARETPDGLELIDGHLRQEVMGDQPVPVLIVDVTEEEADKMLLTLDPLAMMAEADTGQLLHLLRDTQFESQAVNDMLEALANGEPMPVLHEPPVDPGPQIDRADELREKWQTERGQVWEVGRHRLMCGDNTDAEDCLSAFGQYIVGCVLTDPPYGISLDTKYSRITGSRNSMMIRDGRKRVLANDYTPVIGDSEPFDASRLTAFFAEVPEQFWFGANYYRRTLGGSDLNGSWLVWDKRPSGWNDDGAGIDDVIGSGFELIWSKNKHQQRMLRRQWSGFTARNNGMERSHPTEKPVDLLIEILKRWTAGGCVIADPFIGSGTTMVAAEQLGRICYGMEIEPKYVAVTLERMAGMGLEPKLVTV